MSTYTQILYQIVFSTKNRERTITNPNRQELFKDIKLASTEFIKKDNLFENFRGWQDGYGAFTYSVKEKERLIELLKEHEIEFDERYLL